MDATNLKPIPTVDKLLAPALDELQRAVDHGGDSRHVSYSLADMAELLAGRAAEVDDALRPLLEPLLTELGQWRTLLDPVVLHQNLLRGVPARLPEAALRHLIGEQGNQPPITENLVDRLTRDIMNMPCPEDPARGALESRHHKEGHRDARHAAVELVNEILGAQAAAAADPVAIVGIEGCVKHLPHLTPGTELFAGSPPGGKSADGWLVQGTILRSDKPFIVLASEPDGEEMARNFGGYRHNGEPAFTVREIYFTATGAERATVAHLQAEVDRLKSGWGEAFRLAYQWQENAKDTRRLLGNLLVDVVRTIDGLPSYATRSDIMRAVNNLVAYQAPDMPLFKPIMPELLARTEDDFWNLFMAMQIAAPFGKGTTAAAGRNALMAWFVTPAGS